MLCAVDSWCWLLAVSLAGLPLWGQRPSPDELRTISISAPAIFPTLTYGPGAWSVLHLFNPAASTKTVKVDVYRGTGEHLPIETLYTLKGGATADIRIDGQTSLYESCWARIEDVSVPRQKPALQASAREERVVGNRLENYPKTVGHLAPAARWVTLAQTASEKRIFFLNVSNESTVLKVCATDDARNGCDTRNRRTSTVTANAKQSVVLDVARLRSRYFLIESSNRVDAIIGLLRPEEGTSRVFSSETSITFEEPAR